MTRTVMIVALAFSAFLVPPTCAHAAVLYGADGAQGNPSSLRILDPATGALVSTVVEVRGQASSSAASR